MGEDPRCIVGEVPGGHLGEGRSRKKEDVAERGFGDWFEGRAEGSSRRGLFPASYVQVTDGLVQARKVDTIIKPAKDTNSVEQVSSTLVLKERPCTVKAPESNRLHELQGTPYRVLFNHSPKNKDELQLNTGDMVTVTQQCDDGWYVGVCWRTQKFGTFPGNFVVPCESP
ncbi:hypothetical protein GDO78_004889 [Eleutherodactylus coqui]|uniref:SH3 domain-containing protein n=1 Tax=Eleutherodactylus coqui TaxID=57060 RepID=A0A8J6FIM3_ELECQ|nr:hypothetical protein GDO78_004889 [Eleutherodactylus coqui]